MNVANKSSKPLDDVQVIARGTLVRVGSLAHGTDRTVLVCPKGESSLQLRFRAAGIEHIAPADTYL